MNHNIEVKPFYGNREYDECKIIDNMKWFKKIWVSWEGVSLCGTHEDGTLVKIPLYKLSVLTGTCSALAVARWSAHFDEQRVQLLIDFAKSALINLIQISCLDTEHEQIQILEKYGFKVAYRTNTIRNRERMKAGTKVIQFYLEIPVEEIGYYGYLHNKQEYKK